MIKIVGKTLGNKLVVSGLFRLFETDGIPLEIIFQVAITNNCIPCWLSFYKEAKAAGMQHDRILSRLEPAISDSYGLEWANHVIETLTILYDQGRL